MNKKVLKKLGIPKGHPLYLAKQATSAAQEQGMSKGELRRTLKKVVSHPHAFTEDPIFKELAATLLEKEEASPPPAFEEQEPVPYRQWGSNLDPESIRQIERACRLPVSITGALMPDAHVGYGLPIGGVLATKEAVIPYAVGVDIACRMKMSVLDLPPETIDKREDWLIKALNQETRFGIGAEFKPKRQHPVMDKDWNICQITAEYKDKAWAQLGTSGSGNHFVEYGLLEIKTPGLGLEPGTYLALLSHSGSRGTGAQVAGFYSRLARDLHPELPKELSALSWLGLNTHAGQEYWNAMQLMGEYAAANHDCIHRHIAAQLGVEVILDIENHHNFAWRETLHGEEIIVHRKGATPAHKGVVGIIPGSMATPGYVVRGKGNPESINSAAHGAGRVMSRKQAKKNFSWPDTKAYLEKRKVKLLSAGLDEVPMVYKDINEVMSYQEDLVDQLAVFTPRIVKMAPAGEKPED